MQSAACTVVGNEIGRGNVLEATRYYRVVVLFIFLLGGGQTIAFYYYFDKIIETVTEVKALQDICYELAPIFVLNIVPDVTRAVLRGVIKALTL